MCISFCFHNYKLNYHASSAEHRKCLFEEIFRTKTGNCSENINKSDHFLLITSLRCALYTCYVERKILQKFPESFSSHAPPIIGEISDGNHV